MATVTNGKNPFIAWLESQPQYAYLLKDKAFPYSAQLWKVLTYPPALTNKEIRHTIRKAHREWRAARRLEKSIVSTGLLTQDSQLDNG